ncbi:MAG: adenosylcobinamide-phosphate synthase CbiB [Roseobacter sp.]
MSLALLLVAALVLDALLGEPEWLWSRVPHPAVLMGKLVGSLDHTLNHGAARKLKGCVALVILIAVAGLLGWIGKWAGPIVEVLIAAILLAQKSLVQHVKAVAIGLNEDLSAGRAAVSMIVSRDTSEMDASQIARAAIESGAENFSDGVIAPAFWFLIGGLPGIIIYKMVNTADSMIGYRTPKYEDFGWASARCDDLLNLVPARLTVVLIALPGACVDLAGIRRDARQHRSPNAGWPEAVMARALDIALSGPRAYDGQMRAFPWVNDGARRTLSVADIDGSVTMLWKAWAVFVSLCASLAFFVR